MATNGATTVMQRSSMTAREAPPDDCRTTAVVGVPEATPPGGLPGGPEQRSSRGKQQGQ